MDEPPLTADQVRNVVFERQRDGYDPNHIDGLLEDVAWVLEAGGSPAGLVPADPESTLPRLREGYGRADVNRLLASIRGMTYGDPPSRTASRMVTKPRLVIHGPTIVDSDGARLGRVDRFADRSVVINDAMGQVVASGRPQGGQWTVNGPDGAPFGRLDVRHGKDRGLRNLLRRAELWIHDAPVGVCVADQPPITERLKRWKAPMRFTSVVSDPGGAEVARIESQIGPEHRATLEMHRDVTEPVRRLLLVLTAGPATPFIPITLRPSSDSVSGPQL